MTVAILYQEELKEYDFGSGHPFHGDRYPNFIKFLQNRLKPEGYYRILAAPAASENELSTICDEDYVHFCRDYYQAVSGGWIGFYENFGRYLSVDNKPIGTPGNVELAARIIIGQARTACDLVLHGEYQKVISIGGGMHHAKRRFGEGFCVYNDVAFTALYLLEHCRLERVLVLDTDAHAGNGTAEYLRGNPRVLYIDMHQDPRTIYPGTGFVQEIGVDAAKGRTVNIPLPVHAGNESYRLAFDRIILPMAREFMPQVVVRNGGSDPHFNDGLTYLGVTIAGFRGIGEKVRELADICGGRQIDLIASGYNSNVLPYAWLALLSGVTGWSLNVEEPVAVPPQFEQDLVINDTESILEEVRRYQRDYWQCLR